MAPMELNVEDWLLRFVRELVAFLALYLGDGNILLTVVGYYGEQLDTIWAMRVIENLLGGGNVRITVAFTTNRRKQQVMAFAIILEMCGPQLTVQIFKVDKDACLPEYERMYERPVFDWHLVKCGASPRLSWDIPELAALSVSNALINVVAHKRALVNAFDEE